MQAWLFRVAESSAQRGFQSFCIGNKARQEHQCFLGKAFAIIMGSAIAVIAIGEPAFYFFHSHQAMRSGKAEQILNGRGIDFCRRVRSP